MKILRKQCSSLKISSIKLSSISTESKNCALLKVAEQIENCEHEIYAANVLDIKNARDSGMKDSLINRLEINRETIDGMIKAISDLISKKDPLWNSRDVWTLENGLTVNKMTVPLGVIAIIYESRPNVTIDAFTLALKSGNSILLRGSSSAINSNRALVKVVKQALEDSPISPNIIELVDSVDRQVVNELLQMTEFIDLVIPRGGASLIKFVTENSRIPCIETGVGNCHIFVDESAHIEKALAIIENAKIQRPGVCNAMETLLIHENIAESFLPLLVKKIGDKVEIRACERSQAIYPFKKAVEEDWETEFLDFILAVKIVSSNDDAIHHIDKYGTKHSEAILTNDLSHAKQFQRQVDAAAVYVNASTRFTDGSAMGFGAEMGISTQKIHARGPMGLNELVSYKYVIDGNGQIRE